MKFSQDPVQDSSEEINVKTQRKVKQWYRQASGPFKKEYLEQCHAKLLEDAVQCTTQRPSTSKY